MRKKILLTGANGQLGTVLKEKLNSEYGADNVIISDISTRESSENIFLKLDVLYENQIKESIEEYDITDVLHLAAILSAKAEKFPIRSWDVNFRGTLNVMNVIRLLDRPVKMFYPSSIAVFGDTSPKLSTPQNSPLLPTSNYGMAKVAGELWANYFYKKYKTDIRGLRFPGIISYQSAPGGGTTDYAIEMYMAAVNEENYTSYINADTRLPMIYIDDALQAVVALMETDSDKLKIRTAYNLASISFTPDELHRSILKYYPNFKVVYKPDFRQEIAESWTQTIDDTKARNDWGWKPKYNLDRMTESMIKNLKIKLNHE